MARILLVLIEVLLIERWLLLSNFDRLGLRARRRLIETRTCSLWLSHIEGYWLGPWLIRLEIVVVDVIVVYDVRHILCRLLIAPVGHRLRLVAGW